MDAAHQRVALVTFMALALTKASQRFAKQEFMLVLSMVIMEGR
jgi:hypothetical protein